MINRMRGWTIRKYRLPWAALVVLLGWADVILTLIGQPAGYWANHQAVAESDLASRSLLVLSPWLFLAVGLVFHVLEGWLVLILPKWIAVPVAAYCIVCGIIAIFLWSCMLGLTNLYWLYASTGAYAALIGLMAAGLLIGAIRILKR